MSVRFRYCLILFIVKLVSTIGFPQYENNESGKNQRVPLQQHGWNTLDKTPTLLFAHRGEKVLLPENSLAGYETASILGADYVEPDLCLTKDNVFVCHHDLFLRDGTDVRDHPEFDSLKRKMDDGTYNWYIRDFTLKQLKTLRLIQQNTGLRPQEYNSLFAIPTFQEYLNVIHKMTYKLNKTIGVVPELKNPTFHNTDMPANFMEKKFLEVLAANGYPVNNIKKEGDCKAMVNDKVHIINCPPVIIQCFEKPALKYLKDQCNLDLMVLVEEDPLLLTYKGIEEISKIVKYYAPWKEYLYVGVETDLKYNNRTWNDTEVRLLGGFIPPLNFTVQAHKLGMKVVTYTFHDSREPSTRGCAIVRGCQPEDKKEELSYYLKLGVDGIFVENIAESKEILRDFQNGMLEGSRKSRATDFVDTTNADNSSHNSFWTTLSCRIMGISC